MRNKEQNYFELQGNFNNISLNTILQQTDIAVWDRLKIKLSSNDFNITGYAENNENLEAVFIVGDLEDYQIIQSSGMAKIMKDL